MNLADVVILIIVVLIIGMVVFGVLKKRNAAKNSSNHKCSGCAYKGFCGKSSKD